MKATVARSARRMLLTGALLIGMAQSLGVSASEVGLASRAPGGPLLDNSTRAAVMSGTPSAGDCPAGALAEESLLIPLPVIAT